MHSRTCLVAKNNKFLPIGAQTEWIRWCRSLLDLYETKKTFVTSDLHQVSHLNMQKWILGHDMKGTDLLMRNLLLDAMLSANQKVPGSGSYVPYFLFTDTEMKCFRGSSETYLQCLQSFNVHPKGLELFNRVAEVVGPLTKIVVKKSPTQDTIIKYRNKFHFPLSVDPQFERMLGAVGTIEQTNPIVLMIEGAPETVGEINNLLEWNHRNKRPVTLVARNFTEEISATLATNWIRGSLSVLPVVYGNTIESINLAADLCAITKGELISPHFGDVMTSALLKEDKWGKVDRLQYTAGQLSLEANTNVDRHIRSLMEKLKTIEEEDLQKIYRDRILSLSNDAIEVWIDENDTSLIDTFDGLVKHYNGFVTSGISETSLGRLPKCFLDTAKECAESLRKEILNIGGFLVGVDDEMVVG